MLLCSNIGKSKIRKLCLTVPESDWLAKDRQPLNEDSRIVHEGDIHVRGLTKIPEYVTSWPDVIVRTAEREEPQVMQHL